ncbi:MAG: hypothetical protein RL076_952 [Chloroflexota bacterium]
MSTTTDNLHHIDTLIGTRLAAHASHIAEEALNSTAVAIPRHVVAKVVLAVAQSGNATFPRVWHAAAALELIRAGSAMHRRLVNSTSSAVVHGPTLMLGDYFYALAANEMAESPHANIIADYSTCVMRVAEAFLTRIPLSDPAVLVKATAHVDAVEGEIMQRAVRAGSICGQHTHFGDGVVLGNALGRYVASALHIREAQTNPLHSLARGIVILPIAYALQNDYATTHAVIERGDGHALTHYLERVGALHATQHIQDAAGHIITTCWTAVGVLAHDLLV